MPTITQLPSASALTNGSLFAIDESGTTFNVTASLVLSYITSSLSLGTAAFVNVPIVPANGGTGVISPTIHTLPVAQGTSNYNFVGPLTNGQLLIGSTGADPIPSAITAGTNISISNTAGGITISATGGAGFTWNTITLTSQLMVTNNGYIVNNASLVTLTLPVSSNVGDELIIIGKGAGGWSIVFNGGQYVIIGNTTATTSSGSVSSTNAKDTLYLVCTVANTEWETVGAPQGNLTIV